MWIQSLFKWAKAVSGEQLLYNPTSYWYSYCWWFKNPIPNHLGWCWNPIKNGDVYPNLNWWVYRISNEHDQFRPSGQTSSQLDIGSKRPVRKGVPVWWVPKWLYLCAPWNVGLFLMKMYHESNVRISNTCLVQWLKRRLLVMTKLINWSLLGCFGRFVPRVPATHMGIHRGENDITWNLNITHLKRRKIF